MTIEIHNPEIAQIIGEAVRTGQYATAEDVVSAAVLAWHARSTNVAQPIAPVPHGKSRFLAVCAMARGLADDADFSRDPGPTHGNV